MRRYVQMEKSEGSLRRKSMNPVSPLFEKIDASIEKKANLFENSFSRYAVRAVLACLFLTLGTAVAFAIAMKGEDIAHGLGKILYAFMFSWGLVMILYMNAELGTSNMLYMTVGVFRQRLALSKAAKILFACIFFNMIGGMLCEFLISMTTPFQDLTLDNFMLESIAVKLAKPATTILVEGMFANIVVNTAVLISMRMKEDAGKVITVVFIIFIFAFLGYEHVIANFPAFTLAYFASHGQMDGMTASNVLHNLFFALAGNYIGGGLVMGLGYAWLNQSKSSYVD
ncbi:formate/nitrite transporter family protein [Enterococcus faecium]|uniref:formate/nitrite transporter family protein n=1 Tax=Enterococcus TaxID=1350 RepID=UPI00155F644D|nr:MULTISPECIES: formate/nitrite transporter family protein [Enterococcus]EJF8927645.1 formate/nitrite transporter family protein [Enterococcus faecium]EKO5891659.1 formate/nitrite transporter family protein [Enterococcus faecium]ELY8215421.1 formate/nitrite transporter family protein [Enterococcus faecium]EMC2431988.1 formate/nitrite transporter family protein [Enterococcus faecium]EME7194276.1 formate/nitrite transporter family protein [Enterococcus faecium]